MLLRALRDRQRHTERLFHTGGITSASGDTLLAEGLQTCVESSSALLSAVTAGRIPLTALVPGTVSLLHRDDGNRQGQNGQHNLNLSGKTERTAATFGFGQLELDNVRSARCPAFATAGAAAEWPATLLLKFSSLECKGNKLAKLHVALVMCALASAALNKEGTLPPS
jgi:hypothetical protein